MNSYTVDSDRDLKALGRRMYDLIAELYPLCRSITGDGIRETLRRLESRIPLSRYEVPSGTQVFDWKVPREWNIRDAWVKNSKGERVIDFRESNLHIVGYSIPVRRRMSLEELKPHLFTIPDRPEWIPYRTSYYNEGWGFCLSHRRLLELKEDEYEVCIDASFKDGHLSYGEYYVPGESSDEILISSHACHPSLANDALSGITISSFLAEHIASRPHRYSYRFIFIPATIGAITWLCLNERNLWRVKHGLVLTSGGDAGALSYKRSRRENAEIDRAAEHVLKKQGRTCHVMDFSPYGYDERQFCSPGIDLPVGRLCRMVHGTFPEYHTSADNLSFINPDSLADTFSTCLAVFSVLERNRTYLNLNPKCEPQLGRRGLYRTMGGFGSDPGTSELAVLWVLNLSDGGHSLLDIAERSKIDFDLIHRAALALQECGLLRETFATAAERDPGRQKDRRENCCS